MTTGRTLEELKAERRRDHDGGPGPGLDSQMPIATPKNAWIHPRGGHMGRDAKDWPDPVIFKKVTTPWLLRALSA